MPDPGWCATKDQINLRIYCKETEQNWMAWVEYFYKILSILGLDQKTTGRIDVDAKYKNQG